MVLDGLVIDEHEQNQYDDEKESGRTPKSLDSSDAAVRLALPSTVRNCIFINTSGEGLICPNASTIENNLFLNTFISAITINGLPPASADAKKPAIIKNNTILWSWDDRAPGQGRYSGAGIYMSGPATIEQQHHRPLRQQRDLFHHRHRPHVDHQQRVFHEPLVQFPLQCSATPMSPSMTRPWTSLMRRASRRPTATRR